MLTVSRKSFQTHTHTLEFAAKQNMVIGIIFEECTV